MSRPLPYDVLVLDVAEGDQESLALFVSCRTANYELPIVLTGADPGADVAVELLVLGALLHFATVRPASSAVRPSSSRQPDRSISTVRIALPGTFGLI